MHVHQGSIPIALMVKCAILTLHVVSNLLFFVDQVGRMLPQAVLFHARAGHLLIAQKTSSVFHLLRVTRSILSFVVQILKMLV